MESLVNYIVENFWLIGLILILAIHKNYTWVAITLLVIQVIWNHIPIAVLIILILIAFGFNCYRWSLVNDVAKEVKENIRKDPDYEE